MAVAAVAVQVILGRPGLRRRRWREGGGGGADRAEAPDLRGALRGREDQPARLAP